MEVMIEDMIRKEIDIILQHLLHMHLTEVVAQEDIGMNHHITEEIDHLDIMLKDPPIMTGRFYQV